ncbi:MAG TPA: RHS repeat-associated core domain-containing protein [Saprospiraceae bacterium]|nr:RHS repeat-associated core domain-containing protein [Saprospiraceae bacterium]
MDKDKNGEVDIVKNDTEKSELIGSYHYYPFGMTMEGKWTEQQGEAYEYQYNSKEFESDLGLNWYDYGARWYDASLGRWISVDPLADAAPSWTPYRYGFDNPMRFYDPYGQFEIDEETARQHKRFASYLRLLEKTYANKPTEFRAAFKQYSELSDSQISEMLTYGSGPKITIHDLEGANGTTPMLLNEKGEGRATGEIVIDSDIVDYYEAAYENLMGDEVASKTAELALESTLFHEATHYGDIMSDGKLTQTGVEKTPFGTRISKTGVEGGKAFEISVYGQDLVHDQSKFADVRSYVMNRYASLSSGPRIEQDATRVSKTLVSKIRR